MQSDEDVVLCLIGHVGVGKSALANVLTSSNNYPEGNSSHSVTQDTVGFPGTYHGFSTFVIDNPGLFDAAGNDTYHLIQMGKKIRSDLKRLYQQTHREVFGIKAFVVVLNFSKVRLDNTHTTLLGLLKKMFKNAAKPWYQNIAVVWTHYSRAVMEELEITQDQRRRQFITFLQQHFPEIGWGSASNIPQYFINNRRAVRNSDYGTQRELTALLEWAQRQRSPIRSIHILEDTKEERRTVTRGRSEIKEKRIKKIYTDGTVKYGPWMELSRVTRHRDDDSGDCGGGCNIL